jgi:glycosyltransferase involved in cell wall biosynthesis
MPKITALLHTHNDALRLGRALESLRACDELLVIDDCSEDGTEKIARQHGATLKTSISGVTPGAYVMDASNDWVLCVGPNEAVSEGLEAALFEWKEKDPDEETACFMVAVREENDTGWQLRDPEVRLINRKLVNWIGEMPPNHMCETTLAGELLRFHLP